MKKLTIFFLFVMVTLLFAEEQYDFSKGCFHGKAMAVYDYYGKTNHFLDEVDSVSFVTIFTDTTTPKSMKKISAKGATFQMGSSTGDGDEMPIHQVTFTYDFFMDSTEVTQENYSAVMSATYRNYKKPPWNATSGIAPNKPANYISWYNAALYCNARSKAEGKDTVYRYSSKTGTPGNNCILYDVYSNLKRNGYRLPTEAEWEFACCAGSTTDFYWGQDYLPYPTTVADSNEIDTYAIWSRNAYFNKSSYGLGAVAMKKKNAFGLYDMLGNVWEWCNDYYGSYSANPQVDPEWHVEGTHRVKRGGAWNCFLPSVRSTNRAEAIIAREDRSTGFRTVYRQTF